MNGLRLVVRAMPHYSETSTWDSNLLSWEDSGCSRVLLLLTSLKLPVVEGCRGGIRLIRRTAFRVQAELSQDNGSGDEITTASSEVGQGPDQGSVRS